MTEVVPLSGGPRLGNWFRSDRRFIVGVAEQYLKKGSKVYIEGQLETRKWIDKDGQEKYTTEIVLRPYRGVLTMLESAKKQSDGSTQQQGEAHAEIPAGAFDIDDEIPF